jgi:hypothetical protein
MELLCDGLSGEEGLSQTKMELVFFGLSGVLELLPIIEQKPSHSGKGLNQALLLNIQDMVVLGDSRVIIQALNKNSRLGNATLQHLFDKIKLLLRQFRTFQIFHVLRENNS